MSTRVLPDRSVPPEGPHVDSGRSCVSCGIPMIARAPDAKPLCGNCRSQILTDISRRSADIRACIGVLQTSPSPSNTEYETARQHLLVLAEYERQGVLNATPSAGVMLQRLEALNAEHRARLDARAVSRGVRDDGPRADWVGDSTRSTAPRGSPRSGSLRADRRSEPRRRTSLTVVIQSLGVTAVATDISRGGIYLQCGARRSPGSPIRLVLHTASGPVVTQGVVRRVDKTGHRLAAATSGLAIQFTKIAPAFSLDLLG